VEINSGGLFLLRVSPPLGIGGNDFLAADMDSGETTAVVIMALVLSLLATLYPSWRAARLDPVEALRYE